MTKFIVSFLIFIMLPNIITLSVPQGVWSGVLLPLNASNDKIIWNQLRHELSVLLQSGINGVYTSGTAEELWSLSLDEFTTLGNIVSAEADAAGLPYQIGCSQSSPQLTLDRLSFAVTHWPTALAYQVALPDWFPVTNVEAETFLKKLYSITKKLVLYNPGNAKRVLEPSDYAWKNNLTKYLIGLKVVDGDASWYAGIRNAVTEVMVHTNNTLSIGVPGHHFASGYLQQVATCSYSNIAALSPSGAAKWYHQMQTKPIEALALEGRINNFFQDIIVPFHNQGYSDMALDKLLATMGNWVNGTTTKIRWPYRSIAQDDAVSLRSIVRERLPELF